MGSRFLVSAQWLEDHLDDPELRVFDTSAELRFDPATGRTEVASGRDEWQRGHIPGAGFVDLLELCDPSAPGEYMLPSAEHFARGMSALGVGVRTRVVVYDSGAAIFATRLWWMLRIFGFDAVSVLDGGLPEWRREGGARSRRQSRRIRPRVSRRASDLTLSRRSPTSKPRSRPATDGWSTRSARRCSGAREPSATDVRGGSPQHQRPVLLAARR